jgi:glycosyltransferase involved in cell wall biosynthesis
MSGADEAAALRVLLVGPLPPPVGGMASVVQNLLDAFRGRLDVRVLNTVKTTAADRPLWAGVVAQLGLLGALARHCILWRPDVVHIHTCSWFSFWRSGVDVLLAWLLGRRVVLHIHGGQFGEFLAGLSFAQARLARLLLRIPRRVIVLGAGWRDLLESWVSPARVVVVPNGVAAGAQVQPDAAGPFRILCLAHYQAGKGLEDLLRAVAALRTSRRVRLELFGSDAELGYRRRLVALAAELGLADAAIAGPVVGALKDAALASAHCFCLPSYAEGLPMSMLEAMAVGLPVVATRVGAIPEALDDGREGLLFAPGDIAALTAHLGRLIADPAAAMAIGAAGRARLVREFSLAQSAAQLLDVYRAVARRSGTSQVRRL